MIVIKIELWPHGDRRRKKNIGTVVIANDGTGTPTRGNYHCVAAGRGNRSTRPPCRQFGRVVGFARKSRSAYDLLKLALEAMRPCKDHDYGDALLRFIQRSEIQAQKPQVTIGPTEAELTELADALQEKSQ